MNLRALTRGDAAVAGAAVLLLVASFLPFFTSGFASVSAWNTGLFPILPSIFLLGIVAAALILLQHLQGEAVANRQVLGLRLDQWGTALAVAALWSSLWALGGGGDGASAGLGAYLAFVSLLVMAGSAAAGPLVPALQAPLLTDKPAVAATTPQGFPPYAAAPGQPGQPGHPGEQHGQYGYPGAPVGQDPAQGQAPYGAQPPAAGYGYPGAAQPVPQDQAPAPAPAPAPTPAPAAPAAPFAPFWFAVPAVRRISPKDNPAGPPVGELVPGTWYLAVEQRGTALVAQLPDGTHGLLSDTSGIQRG